MKRKDGNLWVPAQINKVVTIDFVIDSGASDITLPKDVYQTLIRSGTLTKADYIGTAQFGIADGSEVKGIKFKLASLQVGNQTLTDVVASVMPSDSATPLLGLSFLSRFQSWAIDKRLGHPEARPAWWRSTSAGAHPDFCRRAAASSRFGRSSGCRHKPRRHPPRKHLHRPQRRGADDSCQRRKARLPKSQGVAVLPVVGIRRTTLRARANTRRSSVKEAQAPVTVGRGLRRASPRRIPASQPRNRKRRRRFRVFPQIRLTQMHAPGCLRWGYGPAPCPDAVRKCDANTDTTCFAGAAWGVHAD